MHLLESFIERKISIANKIKKFEKAFNITDTVEHDIGMLLLITLSNFSFFSDLANCMLIFIYFNIKSFLKILDKL